MKKYWEFLSILKGYKWILYRHVFAHVLWIKITQIRAHCQLWRTLIALLKGEQIIKMLEKMCQIRWQKKNRRFYVAKCQYAQKMRAHARVRNFFIKCSIWPETYVKKIWDDLEHFKFLRARKRADKRARAHLAHVYWPEIDRTDIDLIHDKYEWKITFRYEDMIISWFSQNGAWMTSWWFWVFEKSRSSK